MPKCTWKKHYGHYTYLEAELSVRKKDMKACWKLYIDAKFYADHEYAIYFILKVSFTKVIAFPSTPQMYRYTGTFPERDMTTSTIGIYTTTTIIIIIEYSTYLFPTII